MQLLNDSGTSSEVQWVQWERINAMVVVNVDMERGDTNESNLKWNDNNTEGVYSLYFLMEWSMKEIVERGKTHMPCFIFGISCGSFSYSYEL